MDFSLKILPQLPEQLDRTGVPPGSERGHSTCSVDGHRPQQVAELTCRARIEAAVGAAGQARDVSKHVFDLSIATFLEHEDRHPKPTELAGFMGERIGIVFHGIPDKDQRAHLEQLRFLPGVDQDFLDLGMPGIADDL